MWKKLLLNLRLRLLLIIKNRGYVLQKVWNRTKGRTEILSECGEPFLDENGKTYRLVRLLDDSDDIIEEAKESKRKMDKAFEQMFGMNY